MSDSSFSCYTPSSSQSSIEAVKASPPALSLNEIEPYDETPFSESFSDWMEMDDSGSRCMPQERSFLIENIEDPHHIVPGWDDDDVDEILIISRKIIKDLPDAVDLSTIMEDADESLLTNQKPPYMPSLEFDTPPSTSPRPSQHRSGTFGRVSSLRRLRTRDAAIHIAVMCAINNLESQFLTRMTSYTQEGPVLNIHLDMGAYFQSLAEAGTRLGAGQVQRISSGIVQGLLALEEAGIVHRALSPECILLDEQGSVQLTNFDNATFHHRCNDTGHSFNGIETAYLGEVAEYRAPEVLLGWEVDFSADSWGFGLVLHFMSTGHHAFKPVVDGDLSTVLRGSVSLDFGLAIPCKEVQDLISACVMRNPAHRLSAQEIRQHAYFTSNQPSRHGRTEFTDRRPSPLLSPLTLHPASSKSASLSRDATRSFDILRPTRPLLRPVKSSSCVSKISQLSLDGCPPPTVCRPTAKSPATMLSDPVAIIPATLDSPATIEPFAEAPAQLSQSNMTSTLPTNVSESPRARMDRFWESLDDEMPTSPMSNVTFEATSLSKLRTRKSFSALNAQRLSVFVSDKLRKKPRRAISHAVLKTPDLLADLPNGVKQMGHGIGFTYSAGTAPQAGVAPPKRFGFLKSKKSRATFENAELLGARVSASSEMARVQKDSMEFFQSPSAGWDSTGAVGSASPLSDVGPMTPPLAMDLFTIREGKDVCMSPSSVRLVPSSGTALGLHPFYGLAENDLL